MKKRNERGKEKEKGENTEGGGEFQKLIDGMDGMMENDVMFCVNWWWWSDWWLCDDVEEVNLKRTDEKNQKEKGRRTEFLEKGNCLRIKKGEWEEMKVMMWMIELSWNVIFDENIDWWNIFFLCIELCCVVWWCWWMLEWWFDWLNVWWMVVNEMLLFEMHIVIVIWAFDWMMIWMCVCYGFWIDVIWLWWMLIDCYYDVNGWLVWMEWDIVWLRFVKPERRRDRQREENWERRKDRGKKRGQNQERKN